MVQNMTATGCFKENNFVLEKSLHWVKFKMAVNEETSHSALKMSNLFSALM